MPRSGSVADCWAANRSPSLWQEQDSASQARERSAAEHTKEHGAGHCITRQEMRTYWESGTGNREYREPGTSGIGSRESGHISVAVHAGDSVPSQSVRTDANASGCSTLDRWPGARDRDQRGADDAVGDHARQRRRRERVLLADDDERRTVIVASVARLSGRVRSASSASMTPSASDLGGPAPHLDRQVRVRSASSHRARPGSMASGRHRSPLARGDILQRHAAGARLVGVGLGPRVGEHERRESPTVAGASTRTRCTRPSTTPPAPPGRHRVTPPGRARRWHGRSRGVPAPRPRGDLPKPRRSGAMPRQPAGSDASCGVHMRAVSGNACRKTMGVPSPASVIESWSCRPSHRA